MVDSVLQGLSRLTRTQRNGDDDVAPYAVATPRGRGVAGRLRHVQKMIHVAGPKTRGAGSLCELDFDDGTASVASSPTLVSDSGSGSGETWRSLHGIALPTPIVESQEEEAVSRRLPARTRP